jgi:menaquinone-dependent protoporphyrinogen oxidase
MKIVIVYATTEGQTRKIARHAASYLSGKGHAVEVLSAGDVGSHPLPRGARFIVAGSVHAGGFQPELVEFLRDHRRDVEDGQGLFLCVSLTAAGRTEADWQALEATLKRFRKDTGWAVPRLVHVAGAIRFSEYDFFRSWAMRWIAAERGHRTEGGKDVEFTDWQDLERDLDHWLTEVSTVAD